DLLGWAGDAEGVAAAAHPLVLGLDTDLACPHARSGSALAGSGRRLVPRHADAIRRHAGVGARASVLRRLDALWRGHGGIDRRARQRGSIDGRGRHREYCRWLRRLHRARLDDAVGRREAVAGKDRPADAAALAALVAG